MQSKFLIVHFELLAHNFQRWLRCFVVLCLMFIGLHCISTTGRVHRPAGLKVIPAPSATRHLQLGVGKGAVASGKLRLRGGETA